MCVWERVLIRWSGDGLLGNVASWCLQCYPTEHSHTHRYHTLCRHHPSLYSSSESDSGISRLSRAFARSLIMHPTWRSRAAAAMMLRMRCAGLFADDVSRASRRSHLGRQQLSLQLVRTRTDPGQSPQLRAADSGLVREPTGRRLPTEPAVAPSEPAAGTWTRPLPQPRSCTRHPAACT